jgi:beta-lactamase regulating signal transducer with metallopeptidase domain
MDALLLLLKATLLLSLPLLAARLLRRAPAAVRHGLWTLTFAVVLVLPFLTSTLPTLAVPVPARWLTSSPSQLNGRNATAPFASADREARPTSALADADRIDRNPVRQEAGVTGATAAVVDSSAAWRAWPTVRVRVGVVLSMLWLVGTIAATFVLLVSLIRVWRLARTAEALDDPAWRHAADAIGARLGLRRSARLLASARVGTPMAAGVWRPLIFLPASAREWNAECRDVVLAHEIAHLAVRDPLRHVTARLAVACYWFHPLAWIAARQSTLAREQACDEAVLALGIRPSEYARVLLELADTMTPSRRAAAALPMVERSLLETRLMAILDHSTRPSRLRPIVPAVCAASLALILAAAQPAARSIDVRSPAPVTPAVPVSLVSPPAAVTPSPSAAVRPAPQARRDTTCWTDHPDREGTFTGYTDTDERGVIRERVGSSGGTWIIQQRYGDIRMCMFADGERSYGDKPSAWADRGPHVVIETVRGGSTARLEIVRQGGAPQTTYRVNGADRPFDAAAQAWRDAALAVLDRTWEISSLRGRESTLYGEISTLRGEESTLRGEIATLRGEISTMRGRQSSIRGEESMLHGEIATLQGQASSLRGQISSEQGSISALRASRYGLTEADRARLDKELKAHEAEIARIEKELREFDAAAQIAEVEKSIRALDAAGKVAAIEAEIRNFGEAGKVAEIEKQIKALNVEGKTADLERQISGLDVDRRTREVQAALDEALKRLEQALAAIR